MKPTVSIFASVQVIVLSKGKVLSYAAGVGNTSVSEKQLRIRQATAASSAEGSLYM